MSKKVSQIRLLSNSQCPKCKEGKLHFCNLCYKADSISTLDFRCDNPECNFIFSRPYHVSNIVKNNKKNR